ncbi:MAG: hypothetical protein FWD18_00415 [Micrococcales bacterium]|nr:hypothetical protein [Micrococcales bacterium]
MDDLFSSPDPEAAKARVARDKAVTFLMNAVGVMVVFYGLLSIVPVAVLVFRAAFR